MRRWISCSSIRLTRRTSIIPMIPAASASSTPPAPEYYDAMDQVFSEIHRVLRPDRYMAAVRQRFVREGKGVFPIGFELFDRLRKRFTPVDIVSVVRHNKTLEMGNYRAAAEEGNSYLRGIQLPVHHAQKVARAILPVFFQHNSPQRRRERGEARPMGLVRHGWLADALGTKKHGRAAHATFNSLCSPRLCGEFFTLPTRAGCSCYRGIPRRIRRSR